MNKQAAGLRISEMARLCNTSVDTLRYYDKIGLFQPQFLNEQTGYRYYSILQYEVLCTILELRQIGLSIEEIQQYMNNRNAKQSIDFLVKTLDNIEEQINSLKLLKKTLKRRLNRIKKFDYEYEHSQYIIRKLPRRFYIYEPNPINLLHGEELSMKILELSHQLNSKIPLIANNRIGHKIFQKQFDDPQSLKQLETNIVNEFFLIIEEDDFDSNVEVKMLEAGEYLCAFYEGMNFSKRNESLEKLIQYSKAQGYNIVGDAICIIQIDLSLTDYLEEVKWEIQLAVSKE